MPLGFGVGGALGLVGRGIGKAIMRSGVVDAVANGRTGRAIANSGMGRMLRQSADTPSSQRRAASGAACHSFSEDTLVSTTEGDIEIDEVEVGDTVYAYDERTGEVEEHTVVNTFVHDDDQIVTLTIDGEVVETTPWHPFYTDVGWEDAGDLQPGDRILSLDGDYGVVDSVVIADETQTMYDLDVETVDTFAVGDGAWVVHNLDVCPPLPSPQLDANGLPQSGLWRIRRYTQRIENNLRTMRHSAGKFEFYAEWPITTPRNKAAFESVYESFGLPKQKLSGAVEFNIDIGKWNVIWDPAFRYDDSVNNAIVVSLFPRHFNGEMDIIGSADITQAYADELFNGFNLALPGVNPLFYDVNGNIIQLNDAGNIIRLGGE